MHLLIISACTACCMSYSVQRRHPWLHRSSALIMANDIDLGADSTAALGDVRRTTKSANFICRQNRLTRICCVSCKNHPILSAKIEHVPSLTILSADFLYIGQQILFISSWWLFTTEDEYLFFVISCVCYLFSFIRCRKKWCKYYFAICIRPLC